MWVVYSGVVTTARPKNSAHDVATGATPTDEALAAQALASPDAYAVLVLRHREPLVNFIWIRFIHDRSSAEDITQDSFLKAYVSLRTFDASKKFKTWLYQIAVNTAYSFLRKPQPETLDGYVDVLESGDSPERYADQEIQKDCLEAALRSLDPHHRLVLDLCYRRGLTYAEISAALGIRQSTVKARIHRARQQLAVSFRREF